MAHYPFQLPYLQNFVEFVYFSNVFLPHELASIRKLWQDRQSEKAALEGGAAFNDALRQSSVIGIDPGPEHDWIFERMTAAILQCNSQFYHFDVHGIYEPLQLAQYGAGDFFDWHLDFGTGPSSNRKLSLTVQLSDPSTYEGGDLEFQINNKTVKAPREMGTVVIFPSFIMHRVTPITKGKRQSIVGWVSGPPYR
ncbi:MAG: 2OG-Fe(II) oxygenase [Bacteroidota bacterium]